MKINLKQLTDMRYLLSMESEIKTIFPHGVNKRFSSKFLEGYWLQKTPEEGYRNILTLVIAKMWMLVWVL